MNEKEIDRCKQKYGILLKLCKNVSSEKLKNVKSEREFLSAYVATEPRIDFYLKLLGLQDDFNASLRMPDVPLDIVEMPKRSDPKRKANEEEIAAQQAVEQENSVRAKNAQHYIDEHLAKVKALADHVDLQELEKIVAEKVFDCAAHFSGKLINSDAENAFALCVGGYSGQPHVSSRTILASKNSIPLDQAKQDNTGRYQRVIKILQEEPIVSQAGVSAAIQAAVKKGAKAGFALHKEKNIPAVDYRLRQILLPSGEDYLAVSPLASGGISVLFQESLDRIQNVGKKEEGKSEDSDHPAAEETNHQETAGDDAQETKDADDKESEEEETESNSYWYTRLNFRVGGNNPQNISFCSSDAIQHPVFFNVPTRQSNRTKIWSFVYKPLQVRIRHEQVTGYNKDLEKISDENSALDSWKVILNKKNEKILHQIVFEQHQRIKELSIIIHNESFLEDGEPCPIDKELLEKTRMAPLNPLDIAVLNGSFDQDYMEALANEIVKQLGRLIVVGKEKNPMNNLDKKKIKLAIMGKLKQNWRNL